MALLLPCLPDMTGILHDLHGSKKVQMVQHINEHQPELEAKSVPDETYTLI